MNTTTDHFTGHFEVYGDATFVDLADRFDDVLTTPVQRNPVLMAPSAISIPPSDLPAVELPDYEPTAADLLALESWADEDRIDARIASANTLAAFEARHRDLRRLRAELRAVAVEPVEPDLECAA